MAFILNGEAEMIDDIMNDGYIAYWQGHSDLVLPPHLTEKWQQEAWSIGWTNAAADDEENFA